MVGSVGGAKKEDIVTRDPGIIKSKYFGGAANTADIEQDFDVGKMGVNDNPGVCV